MLLALMLSVAIGLINAARGSGISGMKPVQLIAMGLAAFAVFPDLHYALLCPVPILLMFWIGTGEIMSVIRPVFKYTSWRVIEFLMLFVYSACYFNLWNL